MGRIYCEACGANWRSSGDGPEAQEHHVDVPCIGESTEFKQRARIAVLTERLRAVEAERDSYKTRAQVAESSINRAMGAAHDSMPEYPWNTMRKGEELATACWAWASALKGTRQACDDMHATNSALRAELQRKDAALKDVELAFEEARDCVLNERHELAEQGTTNDSINSVLAILDRTVGAALQPKEPPCKS